MASTSQTRCIAQQTAPHERIEFFVADLDCDAAQAVTTALSASAGPDRAGLKQGLAHVGGSNGLHRLSGSPFEITFFH
jgi:hypothetical protein